jgi:cell fate (sporulation/competence/biofilm development) regulator YmcA (YheA/YmcA/DUF963 family)
MVTESQAEQLQKRIATLPFKVNYQEEQRGSSMVACITCTPSQEKMVRDVCQEIGAAIRSE